MFHEQSNNKDVLVWLCLLCPLSVPPFPFLLHLLTPQHLPLPYLSPAHLGTDEYLTVFSTSQNLKLPSIFPEFPQLSSLSEPTQKEAESSCGSDSEGTLNLQQTRKEESWALSFFLSVWESGILQNWMTLVQRFKSYWRGANRQTDDI